VIENAPAGTTVGSLSASDPDAGETFTYSLVSGDGSTDNASFTIDGNSLKTSEVFDFETKNSYSIRVQAADSAATLTRKLLLLALPMPMTHRFWPALAIRR